jgi:peptidoglycan/xylan/chitin deacetylase (PgdA/CDA1 family)
MFYHQDLKGDDLPPRTVCLTYDDGPGPHTLELGRYLNSEGIAAVFFVIGCEAERRLEVLQQLASWNHTIGNHTYSHPGLLNFLKAGGDVRQEVVRTDAIIRPYHRGRPGLLRPPYGNWRDKSHPSGPEDAPTSAVAERLNGDRRLGHYVGPIKWDIVAEDWACWEQGIDPEEAARRHVEAIEPIGRGIVLMHDSSEDPGQRARNRTMEMTRLLVPMLKHRGYRFVSIEEAPQVKAACELVGRNEDL